MPGLALAVTTDPPDGTTVRAIRALAQRVEAQDGAPPLSDQALRLLGSPSVRHAVGSQDGQLVGYAQDASGSLEIVAEPAAVEELLDVATGGAGAGALVWTHGRQTRLVASLERRGYSATRELYQLRRPLDDAHPLPPDPPLADDVTVRAFDPGHDDAPWLALNAAAFAGHAEQGRWDENDLAARLAEPWFDAAGFLLAERADELVAFHWTKIHADGLGEVYVLGVSPSAQGLGLGAGLLVRGLRYLHGRGCPAVLLYVDGDNPGAIRLYEKFGFDEHDVDVQWRPKA